MSSIFPGLDEARLATLASRMAPALRGGAVVYLQGDLGAGKTTLARALIHALGCRERVKSPTYSLIERYQLTALEIAHLDLYRLVDGGELLDLGLDELLDGGACLLLIEWPDKGGAYLPTADLRIALEGIGDSRDVVITAESALGEYVLQDIGD